MFKGIIEKFEQRFLQPSRPRLESGDVVEVKVWIHEGNKRRLQSFEGTTIAVKHRGLNSSFTLRRSSSPCSVERVFPLHSPLLEQIRVLRKGKVRRAKLYYLRGLSGKAARIQERIVPKTKLSTTPPASDL